MTPASLVDGAPADTVGIDSRGLAYGDGVFRTLRLQDGGVLHADEQWRKLAADAQRLDLEVPPLDVWLADTAMLNHGQATGVAKWLLVRRSEGRGYRPTTRAAQRIVQVSSLPPRVASAALTIAALRLAAQPALAGIKHLNRLEQVLAARELRPGTDELLMCDHDGFLVGGLRSNLFWVHDGRLLTPFVDRCGIAGTMRARVLRIAAGLGVAQAEVREGGAALMAADEIFVTNALVGIWPAHRVETRGLQAPGPLTQRLARELGPPFLI
ncbi:aminodeoxychorismate lyase [Solimonas marina]|uniref:Aminodeoxychorismate lyase n=1 Tax=Solimonas marina TaxID=2714601 RepID=A0A969WE65_9GAMM|nr:aminodeoxychorismate lyase [Solimonas marina]